MATFYPYSVVAEHGNLPRLMRELKLALAEGQHERMQVPMREVVSLDSPRAAFVSMPAVSEHFGIYINKVATIFARSATDPLPTVNAVVAAFSVRSGELVAMLDGAAVTNLKCAAVSALVTDLCAPTEARVLAIAGTGVQARQQVTAVCSVRPIQEIRIWARSAPRSTAFASEVRASLGGAVRVFVCESLDDAIRTADVIGTATSSKTPLASFSDLSPTVHINCMGGHTVDAREVPHALLRASTLIVEDLPTAIAEAGEVHAHAIPLGQLVQKESGPLRAVRTIFSSTGHAFLDVITTAHLLRELGGARGKT
ncbi:ornithine cyclodeaminase family protein [Cystobacter fuscus]|uniref:ornithine cyclodeaminase family protein n=1 Tax=Cystobacter fuscus TaxID=43 RepID=UPI002B282FFB|nr:ornithine cyclodeaminase family protein [Cystobacter fuscus]